MTEGAYIESGYALSASHRLHVLAPIFLPLQRDANVA